MSGSEHRAIDASEWAGLMHGMLDGTLDDAARARFAAEVVADPARAREFARVAMMHDAIEREMTAGAIGRSTARRTRWLLSVRRAAAAVAIAAVVGVLAFLGLRGSSANAAHAELARIASISPAGQRTYVIHALRDDRRQRGREQRRAEPTSPRGAHAQPSIDEATLIVGMSGAYVLVRTAEDGARTVSGSDGRLSWNVPERGAVRVSRDLQRFRGALPGEQHDLPFVDPKDGLDALMRSYDVVLGPAREIDGHAVRSIVATRRADVPRGPKGVELWYDPETAVIRRMELDRLPQAQGGPRAVVLELLDESPLDPRQFMHESHHDADRVVITED
jgi:hypothetical protein